MEVAVQTYWESTQQTAVVTGAAHPAGIGFGIAEALASCGMDVVIMDLPSTLLGESSAKLQENYGVRVLPVPIDITSDQDVEKAVEQIRRFTPTVHALVNNAGIMPAGARLGEMDEGTWSKVLDINLGGPFKTGLVELRIYLPGADGIRPDAFCGVLHGKALGKHDKSCLTY